MAVANRPASHSAAESRIDAFRALITAYYLAAVAKIDAAWAKGLALARIAAPELEGELLTIDRAYRGQYGRAFQVGTVIGGVVIGAALLIGFFVIASIDDALPAINDSDLSTDKNSTVDRIGDGLLIGGVVIIVLYSAVILRVLRSL